MTELTLLVAGVALLAAATRVVDASRARRHAALRIAAQARYLSWALEWSIGPSLRAAAKAIASFGFSMAEATAGMQAFTEAFLPGYYSAGGRLVGEPEFPIDHSKCWRCQTVSVPRDDDVGLCTGCADHLRSL